jgi:excisionase family DNA binding protein
MTATNENDLLTRDQAMKLLKCSSSTFWRYTVEKRFPYYRAGRKMFFRREEVLQAIRVN